jgi:DNA-binding CsgD family transcriptional regulator
MPIEREMSRGASWKDFGLTALEEQALSLTVAGYSSRESALKLSTTEQALGLNLVNIYKKLKVSNRLELVLFTLYHDLVDAVPMSLSGQTNAVRSKIPTNLSGV